MLVGYSDRADVEGFVTLAARSDIELDGLAFIERAETGTLDVGIMHEDVVAICPRDEAEALLGVEELDGACSQLDSSQSSSSSL